jgi:stage II sporulation protein AA (anti-sigma F factor antagonist)
METLEEKVGDVKILHLRGRLDLGATAEFEGRVKALIGAGENRIVLDCRDLKYVSSSGIGAFVTLGKQLANNGALVFAGLTQHVASVFEMTGISRVFTVCKTKEDALRQLGGIST